MPFIIIAWQSLWRRVSVNGDSVKGGSLKGGFCEGGSLWKETETPWYWHLVVANEAGGTHPTGMHSCLSFKLKQMAIKIQPEAWTKSLNWKSKECRSVLCVKAASYLSWMPWSLPLDSFLTDITPNRRAGNWINLKRNPGTQPLLVCLHQIPHPPSTSTFTMVITLIGMHTTLLR